MYKEIVRPVLFRMNPEFVHDCFLQLARFSRLVGGDRLIEQICTFEDPRLARRVFGLHFSNPLGLAAGFDKNAQALSFFAGLGFGFIEVGTVVPEAQSGNPKPRIFRLPEDLALINRMGFPSAGSEAVLENLRSFTDLSPVIALNIGKNKDTPLEKAADDYFRVFISYYEQAAFFVVNVSSPNTPDLRKLQEKDRLMTLLKGLQEMNSKNKPILLKIAPDLNEHQINDVLDCCFQSQIAGIVSCNTTFSRDGIKSQSSEQGGLSGRPLFKRSLEMVKYLSAGTKGKLPIIAVGGIASSSDVIEMLRAGASLIEIYTSLIYEGPFLVKRIKKELIEYIEAQGLRSINDIITA